jgi:peptidyl-tRNA hydrolase, PTH1 family
MYLIVGLGNPEADYAKTRHNMGFNAVNKVAEANNININKTKFNGLYNTAIIEGEKVILLKPQTYMNLSGESIAEFKNFYKIEDSEIIVIYDDIDLEPGTIRIRTKGSAGSHNGMKSVIQCLQTDEFPRIRIGIGKPSENIALVDYVIGYINKEDQEQLQEGVTKAYEAVIEILKNGVNKAMNKFN